MPSTYSASARYVLQATGENGNTWGAILNQGAFQLIDDNVNGRLAFNLSGVKNLTTALGAPDEARMAFLDVGGGTGGTINIPPVPKGYFVRNFSAGDVIVSAGGGETFLLHPHDMGPCFSDGALVHGIKIGGLSIQDYVTSQVSGGGNLPSPVGQIGKSLVVQDSGAGPFWTPALIDSAQLAANCVTALKIAAGAVTAGALAAGAVTTPALAAGSVTNAIIAANAVTATSILDGQVTAPKLAAGAAVASLGYTPLNKAGDTLTGNLTVNGSVGIGGNLTITGQIFLGGAGRAYLSSDNATYAQIVWDTTAPVFLRYAWPTGVLTYSTPLQASAMTLDQNGNVAFAGVLTAGNITPSNGSVTAAKMAPGAAVANIGYTPLNKAGDQVNGNLIVTGFVQLPLGQPAANLGGQLAISMTGVGPGIRFNSGGGAAVAAFGQLSAADSSGGNFLAMTPGTGGLPTFYYNVASGVAQAVTWTATSDRRLKFDIKALAKGLDVLAALTPFTYGLAASEADAKKKLGVRSAGIMAQDLIGTPLERLVHKAPSPDEPILALDTAGLTAWYVAAFKEIKAALDDLTARVEALEPA